MPHSIKHSTVDFFTHEALPAPRVTSARAEQITAESFGLTARAEPLGSQQDANFLLHFDDGTPPAVLKLANPAFGTTEIDAQDAAADLTAADLTAAACPELRLATVLCDPDGARRIATVETEHGPVVARLLRHLPGGTLSGSRYLSPRTVAAMGAITGHVTTALRDFQHPGLDRVLQWDPQYADRVVDKLLDHIPEQDRRDAVRAAAAEAWTQLQKVAALLPRQAVHLDLTDDNMVRSPGSRLPLPDGVIDFGDLTTSWAVGELAMPLSSMLHHDGMEPHHVPPAVRAFHAIRPLSAEEAAALSTASPATVATGLDLWLARAAVLQAPAAGEIKESAPGWLALTADPSPFIGLTGADATPQTGLLSRREAVQEHYYDNPPRIERGWRHHLVSADGRSYLDIVNNVTPLDHAHPGVEQAVSRQLRRLNTNSRFHYASVVEFSERLAALLPDPLDTVFLVDSGSEAVDLGISLAIGATGQHDVVALREAYHGWTYASDAVSTSLQDNPDALASRPSWVHTVDSPNSYRGRHRGAEAARYAPEAVRVIDELCDRMLDLGVVVQPTGDHLNILKIKPPLCIDAAAVDFFTDALGRALTELGHGPRTGHSR
ncbi:aminotransferase class III-fold pyridoxal phosphate-dependent enzyme [Streptosporangium sp. NPDC000396]|uniref:aminotransferase class III-fold pyridoxal phosphate-dependent enzyme n=1 Tax=Streptosporangium sp. NPDC000396 TaxID=3366185 RepID=UPI0036857B48